MYSIENQYMKGQNKLFFAIIIALVLGVIIGGVVHTQFPENTESFSKNIKLLGTIHWFSLHWLWELRKWEILQ